MRWFFDVNAVNIEKPAEECHYPKKAPKPPKKNVKKRAFCGVPQERTRNARLARVRAA